MENYIPVHSTPIQYTGHPSQVDVAVLILFFNRPEPLSAVFEQVRKARPSKLFLYQDGARGEKDMPGILACRKVVDEIDWECKVYQWYQEKNFGCDPSEYLSQKWAFSIVEKCIVLEDDDVPSVNFFAFCKELLDRYENDSRICMISGINYDEFTPNMPYDYFFSTAFSIWGWASWRRVIDQWDEHYSFLDDTFNLQQLEEYIKERKYQKEFIEFCRHHRESGKAYYESIFHAAMFFNSGLSIVPTKNMINNLGATAGSTHFGGSNNLLPKGYRRIFTMKRYEQEFPLKHPRYIIENVGYKNRMFRVMAWGHPWIKIGRSFEELYLNLRYGNFQHIRKSLINRINKWLGRNKWR
ncbi:hemolysin activation protein [Phocaeicola plebeius]|jgi:hypothetical protein|uniref:Hemolysin activation protein n=1 Tax=Phocaeicola plebeius TaxID=310297 RepID=A0A414FTX5_9BACT|nr:hemolysin activation protein [Phocaeicola plebeius]RHD54214.1 hemolysin activation protein [Phocaeicola plebeius]